MGNITDERTSQSDLEQVKERVADVAEQAKDQTRSQLQEQIDTRTTQVGDQMSAGAEAVRRTVVQLRQEGNDRAAGVIEAVADRAERLGTYLTGANGDRILRDAEDFARRQPWLMATAGALTGFLASRFVKASSGTRYQSRPSSEWKAERPPARPASPSAVGGGVGDIH
jgi:hypothetical protein